MERQMYKIKLNSYNLRNAKMLSLIDMKDLKSKEEETAMLLLHRICNANLKSHALKNGFNDLELNEEERSLVIKYEWDRSENIEVRAKCNDALIKYERDRRKRIEEASEAYLSAYKMYNDIDYLMRSIVIRNFPQVNDEIFLKDIVKTITDGFEYPFLIKDIIEALLRSYSSEGLTDLVHFINEEKIRFRDEEKFREERAYIKAQKSLNAISALQYHKELALSYEMEADSILNKKDDNTFNLNLANIYQKAYDEIYRIRKEEELIAKRIMNKLIRERGVFSDLLQKHGIKTKMSLTDEFINHIKDIVDNNTITDFKDTLLLLLEIPFTSAEAVERYMTRSREGAPFLSMFGHSQLNSKGFEIGNADRETALRTEALYYFRMKIIYVIRFYMNKHIDCAEETDIDELCHLINKNKPEFIEQSQILFWCKGILAGLNNDFITAASILTPQFEHALHNIAELDKGELSSLEKKRQLSPTLGPVMKLLKDVVKNEIYLDIDSFLQGETDVNFRNNLSHGLFIPDDVDYYGTYLWWLCLKFFFGEEWKHNYPPKTIS